MYVYLNFLNVEVSRNKAAGSVFKTKYHTMTDVFQKIQAQYLSNHLQHLHTTKLI